MKGFTHYLTRRALSQLALSPYPRIVVVARWLLVTIITLNAALGVLPAMAQGNAHAIAHNDDERNRIVVTLVGDALAPNSVQLSLSATPLEDAPALQILWEVGAAQMSDGALTESLGATAAESSIQQVRTLHLPAAGLYPLLATVIYQPSAGRQYGASAMLFAQVDGNGQVSLSERDPNAVSPMNSQMTTTVIEGEAIGNGSQQDAGAPGDAPGDAPNGDMPQDDPCVTVMGTVTREDRMNTRTGRLAPTRVPVRNAVIEMNEEDLIFDDSYGEKLTDANGNYWFYFCDGDGFLNEELEIYVTLRAELRRFDDSIGEEVSIVEVTDIGFVDDTYVYESAVIDTEGGSYTINFDLDSTQSAVFNMADAAFDAYKFWNSMGGNFTQQTEVRWEPGQGETTSHYDGDHYDEITIADSPNNPDEWDDSVIMHEWGHLADDIYSCDDQVGGPHALGTPLADPEQAWTEAYPDYYQSAVRSALGVPDGSFYIDSNGAGTSTFAFNLEANPPVANINYEDAIAAMLWDLADDAVDGQDMSGVGHSTLQDVYTHPLFTSNGTFDDTCTTVMFLYAWDQLSKPTDAATAASVTQNIGWRQPWLTSASAGEPHPNPPQLGEGTVVAAMTSGSSAHVSREENRVNHETSTPLQAGEAGWGSAEGTVVAAMTSGAGDMDEDYAWWQRVTMVADNSPSMAGDKINAVKTVMKEQVNDLQGSPNGIEFSLYTFNNQEAGSEEHARGRFYPAFIEPEINSIAPVQPNGESEPCKVNAFGALADAIEDKRDGQAWLYTDGDASLNVGGPSIESMQQMLNSRGLHSSFVMLGGCSSAPDAQSNTFGLAYNMLGLAANGTQPAGIVPYLLTAIATGGNFLFVNESQLSDAGEILRAQLSHSAGAGRWSDYVSNRATYVWDRLTRWEYEWITPAPGDLRGQAVEAPLQIAIPAVTIFGETFDELGVDGNGFIQMGDALDVPLESHKTLNILQGDLDWEPVLTAQNVDNTPNGDIPNANYNQRVLLSEQSNAQGEWLAITTEGTNSGAQPRAYQALIHKQTGEIRFQYQALTPGDAGDSLIGLRATFPIAGDHVNVEVSDHDVAGASADMGYKFSPMPPQPTKAFPVMVDDLMGGVGFLLTGFSGTFAPLLVTDPNGTPVNCDAPGTLCLNLGLVQYVQTNVNGRAGEWQATVAPGNSGSGTFAFSALAASSIYVESPLSHLVTMGEPSQLLVEMGAPAEGNQVTAWMQKPDGGAMGGEFLLFDDGAHGDGLAGDGKFGLADFVAPGTGVGYLWVRGVVNGTTVQRSDPTPYTMQPIKVEGPTELPYLGSGTVALEYKVTNLGTQAYCFMPSFQVPDGWSGAWNEPAALCLNANTAATRQLVVTPTTLQDPAPSGTKGEVIVSFVEQERGQIAASAATTLMRYNAPALITIVNQYTHNYLRPNGSDQATMRVLVHDAQGFPVLDGTQVQLAATLGTMTPADGGPNGETINGKLEVIFTAGNTVGDALITAQVAGIAEAAQTTIHIQPAMPDKLTFVADATNLSDAATANLVVTVRDQWGDALAGQVIRIGVGDDHATGLLAAAQGDQVSSSALQSTEGLTLTTDAAGVVAASFTKAEGAGMGVDGGGEVVLRAQLLYDEGDGPKVALEERITLHLTPGAFLPAKVYLPSVRDGTE